MLRYIVVASLLAVQSLIDRVEGFPDLNQLHPRIENANEARESFGNYGCICMPYDQCQNKTDIADSNIARLNDETNPCGNDLDVCCLIKTTVKQDIIHMPKKIIGCGIRYPEGVGFRIMGGQKNEARFGEFPWMVALLKEMIVQGQLIGFYQCGGALIHPQVVLTAAHCVTRRDSVHKIRAGDWDSQTTRELLPHQDVRVSKVVIHRYFNPVSLYNDVALLFLESAVVLDEHINVVCLPQSDFNYTGARCFASGWGKDKFGKEGRYQTTLQKIDLEMVDPWKCEENLRLTRLGNFFKLDDSFVCAGGQQDKDTCTGDGGSPLVCSIPGVPNRFAQVGIVSWGIGCGVKDTPGVYTNVGALRRWIDEQLLRHGLDTIYYNY